MLKSWKDGGGGGEKPRGRIISAEIVRVNSTEKWNASVPSLLALCGHCAEVYKACLAPSSGVQGHMFPLASFTFPLTANSLA